MIELLLFNNLFTTQNTVNFTCENYDNDLAKSNFTERLKQSPEETVLVPIRSNRPDNPYLRATANLSSKRKIPCKNMLICIP